MGKLIDDISTVLDDLLGVSKQKTDMNIFGLPNESPGAGGVVFGGENGGGFGPDTRNMGPMQSPGPDPFSQNPDDIHSIAQVSSTPFKIVDIQPYYVDVATYPCIYKKDVLTQLLGPEGISEEDFNDTGLTTPPSFGIRVIQTDEAGNYWRTVALPFVGNFLKIESLPLRNIGIGSYDILNSNNLPNPEVIPPASDISKSGPGNVAGWTTANVVDQDYWYTEAHGGINYYPNAAQATTHMSKQIFLVSFDSQNAIPLVTYSGTVFKCPYNQVFVTFKTGAGPIRVTSGYNSEIIDRPPDVDGNSNMAMRSPNGFLERPLLHFVPFCVTGDDSEAGLTRIAVNASATKTYVITQPLGTISPEASNFHQDTRKGIGVMWISSFNFVSDPEVTAVNHWAKVTLYISDTSGTLRRLVYRRSFFAYPENGTTGHLSHIHDISFSAPIRVCLHQNEQLRIAIVNGDGTGHLYCAYTIQGYTYGRWRYENMNAGDKQVPMVLLDIVNEHPYPLDNQRTLSGLANNGTGYVA